MGAGSVSPSSSSRVSILPIAVSLIGSMSESTVERGARFRRRGLCSSGVLTVSTRGDGSLAMDFPAWPPARIDAPAGIADALGTPVEWTGRSGNDYLLALVADERAVRELSEAHELTRGAQAPCTGEQPSCTPPFDIQISPLCSHLDVAAA